ncbi:MAG: hypothetical protein GKC09_02100 [Methanosarcinales archaeon]|nr:hypothetical protein [Methanosarcinales archaeon]
MDPEALITEKEIDGTGGTVIRESIHKNMPLIDPRMDHFKIRYFSFGKYRVGIIEDEDQRAQGISSIEVRKDFFNIEQLEDEGYYWDEEAYYD